MSVVTHHRTLCLLTLPSLQELPVDELIIGVALLLLEVPAAQQTSLLHLGKSSSVTKI